MNILFVFGYSRACNYILPAFEQLSASDKVYYYFYRLMSTKENCADPSVDTRGYLYERLSNSGATFIGEPSYQHSATADTYSRDFQKAIRNLKLDIAVFDDNAGKVNWGNILFYRTLRQQEIPVVGCQEGSVEDDYPGLKRISTNLGLAYDYCFCIGNYDYERLKRNNPHLSGRLYSVGLPCNDRLYRFADSRQDSGKHILLVPSYTKKSGLSKIFEPLTDEIIENCGIYKIAGQLNIPIIIKEKGKLWSTECAFKHLESDNIRVTMDEQDLDRLVGEARYVIGAPSTLLFKSIQLRIPTAVLGKPYMGRLGAFSKFEGLTDSSYEQVAGTLEVQEKKGRAENDFIEYAIAGGSEFRSTQLFVEAIHDVYKSRKTYTGPLMISDRPFLDRMWVSYPRQYKLVENVAHSTKDVIKKALLTDSRIKESR